MRRIGLAIVFVLLPAAIACAQSDGTSVIRGRVTAAENGHDVLDLVLTTIRQQPDDAAGH